MYARLLDENDLNRFMDFANHYAADLTKNSKEDKAQEVHDFVERIYDKSLYWIETENKMYKE